MKRACGLLLLALGCGSAAPAPEVSYRLDLPAPAEIAPGSQPAPRLRLMGLSLAPELRGDRLLVAASPVRLEPYTTHRWAAPLELLLEESAARVLAPVAGTDPALPALVLHVHEFCQRETGSQWTGTVAVTAELRAGGATRWRAELRASEPASTRHPEAVVAALSRAWARVLGEVVDRASR